MQENFNFPFDVPAESESYFPVCIHLVVFTIESVRVRGSQWESVGVSGSSRELSDF